MGFSKSFRTNEWRFNVDETEGISITTSLLHLEIFANSVQTWLSQSHLKQSMIIGELPIVRLAEPRISALTLVCGLRFCLFLLCVGVMIKLTRRSSAENERMPTEIGWQRRPTIMRGSERVEFTRKLMQAAGVARRDIKSDAYGRELVM